MVGLRLHTFRENIYMLKSYGTDEFDESTEDLGSSSSNNLGWKLGSKGDTLHRTNISPPKCIFEHDFSFSGLVGYGRTVPLKGLSLICPMSWSGRFGHFEASKMLKKNTYFQCLLEPTWCIIGL